MSGYNHHKIEKKWQGIWQKLKLYQTPDDAKGRENFYALVEFPYPSGNLHVGHWYAFSVPDIFARAKRMQGKNVLFPIGFDAFGLPAENAAIKRGINPRKWTHDNIDYMRKQLMTMGASFDWSREVITSNPEYYKWTQWIFLQFYKQSLAYQAETAVNWCPSCKTVLANEQVIQGRCERCDSIVEQRMMTQWMLRITDYAEKLLKGLEKLDWPDEIKESQRNWIGRSEGAEIEFPVVIPATEPESTGSRVKPGMTNFLILHGRNGSPDSHLFPWLKSELERMGFRVQAPFLPNTHEPNDDEQTEFVIKNCKIDENTIIIGHSFGGVIALRLLERGIKVNKVVLVCTPFSGKFLDEKSRHSVTTACQKGFNFETIKENSREFILLFDTSDNIVPMSDGEAYAKRLGVALKRVRGQEPHLSAKQEPVVLQNILPRIKVFTTRPDTIFGATYMVLAPEHPLIRNYESRIRNYGEVKKYIELSKKKTELERTALEKEKTGVELKGVKAINPATGEEIPIWIADYVIMGYGTGAIMAVPAHDERDWEFAKKYNLPTRQVIRNFSPPPLTLRAGAPSLRVREGRGELSSSYTGEGILVNSGKYNGLSSEKARKRITADLGVPKVQYKMRDWVISRQRYWGVPIPIIHCENCGKAYQVPKKDLPVKLPEIKDYKPKGDGKSPLAKARDWVKVKCPECGLEAERETDTMDTFIDSSWYFLRYCDPKNNKTFAAKEKMRKWMPVDRYSGGAEHTTMHLLYSRFWIKAMHDLGLLEWDEPYIKRMNRGLILGPDGQKMSKSRGNVVDPDNYVKELGADTVRMYLAFIGPYNEVGAYPWNPKGIMGVRRFLKRVWKLFHNAPFTPSYLKRGEGELLDLNRLLHKTIKKVTEDIESFKFNTAVSALMILLNEMTLRQAQGLSNEHLEIFLKLLAPFAPHITEELWQQLGHKQSIHLEEWPQYDKKLVREEFVNIAVQVNGKLRATIRAAAGASQTEVEKLAEQDEKVAKYLAGKKIKKLIYVPGKIINFVT